MFTVCYCFGAFASFSCLKAQSPFTVMEKKIKVVNMIIRILQESNITVFLLQNFTFNLMSAAVSL